MKKLYLSILLCLTGVLTFAQQSTILPGSMLPRVTTAQRMAMENPANGTLVFDVNTLDYWYRSNGVWTKLGEGSLSYWRLAGMNGNEITHNNTGGFWSKNPVIVPNYADNVSNPPIVPVNEPGTRLMWIPSRSAFRAGTVDNTLDWSADSVGLFSFATGHNAKASGTLSVAMGLATKATGYASTAFGFSNVATGIGAVATGYNTRASGSGAFTIGGSTTASGVASFAAGYSTTASGHHSTAIGYWINTNFQQGAFIISDSDPNREGTTYSGAPDEFVARFKNGYYLMTSGNFNRTGTRIGNGETSWSAISDSTLKERFVPADGENFLLKLRGLRLGSWNYKNQGKQPQRFYGPMAQEVFTAYGKDKYGTIGTDTTVSTLNMDGLLFIFAQALEKRTQKLKTENQELQDLIRQLDARLALYESALLHKPDEKEIPDDPNRKSALSAYESDARSHRKK
ncbi:tail fiber domain-containing protein [Emticicia agri]|uniref:Peptidase S74 domain-containing protein n=1 Tax=Emticicia agri TaxID=2492393 RepID=A0A4Q5LUE1_9BACT|nr:tail fiber domain-containing protein [Emticicia agri]RYU93053.1 hypothetical protein EWM59_23990 [Emticicia agri]